MKKKNYLAPQQTVVILSSKTCLLAGSAQESRIDKMNQQYLFDEEEE